MTFNLAFNVKTLAAPAKTRTVFPFIVSAPTGACRGGNQENHERMRPMTKATKPVLVAYDTRLGSTAEVAHFIGEVLAEKGQLVDVKATKHVDNIDDYSLVVIGGAIRFDRWLPGAVDFTRAHRHSLRQVPVAFFFTCLTLASPTSDALKKAASYADQISDLVPEAQPLSVGRFAGVLRFAGVPWPLRLVLRVLSIATGIKEGDYRDWEAIRDWVQSQLVQDHTGTSQPVAAKGPVLSS